MTFQDSCNKIPWVLIFVVGVQIHFLAVIFPEIREFHLHTLGIGIALVSSAFILSLYYVKRRQKEIMGASSSQ